MHRGPDFQPPQVRFQQLDRAAPSSRLSCRKSIWRAPLVTVFAIDAGLHRGKGRPLQPGPDCWPKPASQARAARGTRRERPRPTWTPWDLAAQPSSGQKLQCRTARPGSRLQRFTTPASMPAGSWTSSAAIRRNNRGPPMPTAGQRGIAPGRPGDVDGEVAAQLHRAAAPFSRHRHRPAEPRHPAASAADPPAVRRRFVSGLDVATPTLRWRPTGIQIPFLEAARGSPSMPLSASLPGPGAGGPGGGTLAGIRHPGRTPSAPAGLPSDLLAPAAGHPTGGGGNSCGHGPDRCRHGRSVPRFTISGAAGMGSGDFSSWLTWAQRFWSFGPAVQLAGVRHRRTRFRHRAEEALQEQALIALPADRLSALQEVENA